jgi:dihydrolipoamide dehydrogenase
MANTYDIIVIGSGPAGYVGALRASQLGFKVAIIESRHLGGICLNWGCIPTKTLLHSADLYREIQHGKAYGITIKGAPEVDRETLYKRSREVSSRLNMGVGGLLKKAKVDIIWGRARLAGPTSVTVENISEDDKKWGSKPPAQAKGPGTYKARFIVVATGARARILPGIEPDGQLIWSYLEALQMPFIPKKMIVIGSGAIGVEFASLYQTLGSHVTVVEALPQILPVEDHEVSAQAHKLFTQQGIAIVTGVQVTEVKKAKNQVTVHLKNEKSGEKQTLSADCVLSAVGVVGNIENLGLEAVGVKTERGIIVTQAFGATSVPSIFAIGDVAGPPMLAHKASHEAMICMESLKGLKPHAMDPLMIPGCTYCHPQIASVGLTENRAKELGYAIRIGKFPLLANGKALALGAPDGFIKTLFDAKTGRLLGMHMIGAGVSELIHSAVVAMNLETTEEELMNSIFPHPTLSEAIHESVLSAYGRPLHY